MKITPLKIGDTIGIVATSSPVMNTHFEKSYKRGINEIKKLGLKIKEGKTIYLKKWHFAGNDKERAKDIMSMFLNKEIKAIICAVGGSGANRILNLLDYKIIKKHPKPFMGISDPAVLISALFQLSNIPTVYGPDVCFGFGEKKTKVKKDWEIGMIKNILTSNDCLGKIKPLTHWKTIKNGHGKGYLIGGHLNSYKGLLGTPYFADIKNKPKIFFWETTGSYLSMDEDLVNLRNSGFFKNVTGMLIGKFNLMNNDKESNEAKKNVYNLILDTFKDYNFPILADMDFGHSTPNIPLPLGKLAEMNGNDRSLSILEGLFE